MSVVELTSVNLCGEAASLREAANQKPLTQKTTLLKRIAHCCSESMKTVGAFFLASLLLCPTVIACGVVAQKNLDPRIKKVATGFLNITSPVFDQIKKHGII